MTAAVETMSGVLQAVGIIAWVATIFVLVVARRRLHRSPTTQTTTDGRTAFDGPVQRLVVAPDVAARLREALPSETADPFRSGEIGRFDAVPVHVDPDLKEGEWRAE